MESANSTSLWAAAAGLLSGLGLSLVKLIRNDKVKEKKRDATVETAYISALEDLRLDWRKEIEELYQSVDELRGELLKVKEEKLVLEGKLMLSDSKYQSLLKDHEALKTRMAEMEARYKT